MFCFDLWVNHRICRRSPQAKGDGRSHRAAAGAGSHHNAAGVGIDMARLVRGKWQLSFVGLWISWVCWQKFGVLAGRQTRNVQLGPGHDLRPDWMAFANPLGHAAAGWTRRAQTESHVQDRLWQQVRICLLSSQSFIPPGWQNMDVKKKQTHLWPRRSDWEIKTGLNEDLAFFCTHKVWMCDIPVENMMSR